MCRIASLFLLQRLKGSISGDMRYFNNMETRAVIKYFFFPPPRQGAEGNSRHSDRNIRRTCTIVCRRQKLGGPAYPFGTGIIFFSFSTSVYKMRIIQEPNMIEL